MIARYRVQRGFTLVEMLVSMAIILLLLVFLTNMVTQTQNAWVFGSNKVEEFRGARDAFESVTRRLSQATLNTYWGYQYKSVGGVQTPTQYIRESDLRFLSGSANDITLPTGVTRPFHSIFFQAPLGVVDDTSFEGLSNLVNTWGYYLEFGGDAKLRPAFLSALTPPLTERFRFRLYEMTQPSNGLNIYSYTSGADATGSPKNNSYNGREWITAALGSQQPPPPVHVLADNIIAMVILPKLSQEDEKQIQPGASEGTLIAPAYHYDSAPNPKNPKPSNPALDPTNQLPPLVRVTLVAIPESAALRMATGSTPPVLGIENLFDGSSTASATASKYESDLQTLESTLGAKRISYRVFTTNVSIRAAKWSRN